MLLPIQGSLIFLLAALSLGVGENPDKKCYPTSKIREIPPNHIFHKLKQPIIIGHRGNILQYQENSLEGIENLIDLEIKGVHMNVQLTMDEQVVVFHDDTTKRMTGENFYVSKLPYSEISRMKLQKFIKYSDTKNFTYGSTVRIPLLVDVLEDIRNRGVLIYIEMNPGEIPPRSRYKSLTTGRKVAEIIRDMKVQDKVILVSRDPFKLVSALNTHASLVVGWWFGEDIYTPGVGDGMRKEFIDLPGLRNCYVDAAPLAADKFAEFVVESGLISKSVNTSMIDLDFNIFNNPKYFSGRTEATMKLLAKNYDEGTTFGAFGVYKLSQTKFPAEYTKKLETLLKSGLSRIVTDNIVMTSDTLKRVLPESGAVYLAISPVVYGLAFSFASVMVSFISK